MKFFFIFSFVSLLSGVAPLFSAALDTGEIAGAKFAIARPAHWNHRLLLLAHGYRLESAPLVADLDPVQPDGRALLDEGWMIAKTSYRKNAATPAETIADLDALRDYVEKTYGAPERVILEGEGLGGTAAILMAERGGNLYSGAIAIGAVFNVQEYDAGHGLSLRPKIPLILVANQTDLSGPRSYAEANIPRSEDEPRPAVLRVSRDGRANINPRERLAALRALDAWLDHGSTALPRPPDGAESFDITVPSAPQSSQVVFTTDGHSLEARVTAVDSFSGTVTLNAQPDDFARIGIGKNASFQLAAHEKTFRVTWGRDLAASFQPSAFHGEKYLRQTARAKRAEWIALANADGFFLVGREFADFAGAAHLAVGDTVTIRRYDEVSAPTDEP